ncbi:MAG: DEAD/DEAH box helicase, partial [Psychrobacter sp.]|nr:DEAD/DEAH box helicase [Psychrobacter sp.]
MPNTSKNVSEMPTENTANELSSNERNTSAFSSNQSSNEASKVANLDNDDSNLTLNTDNASLQAKVAADLPVLAKDSYFLSRLEGELARAAVANNKRDKKDSDNKAEDGLAKKRAQYDKIKTRSQQAVQARMDSIPDKLAEKLNLDLPVSQRADDLIQAIIDNQVIIVAGETGSGKTTQLPKLAMLAGRGITGQIGHTQPRRLAARSVANRIAEELGEQLGNTVSFKIRFNEQGTAQSVVKLMTDGILLAELGHDRFLSKYDTIIIDEAHERSLNIDFIMGYLKKLLPKRPDLKVIITSATLDTKRFSEYFSHYDNKLKRNVPAPIFNVEGRSFPVEVRYRPLTDEPVNSSDDDSYDDFEENLPRAVVAAVEECFSDAQNKGHADQADILIFAATE